MPDFPTQGPSPVGAWGSGFNILGFRDSDLGFRDWDCRA